VGLVYDPRGQSGVMTARPGVPRVLHFENLQELNMQDFEQQLAGEQGKWPLTILILYILFLSLVYTLAHML
jgi:hypothetical protein